MWRAKEGRLFELIRGHADGLCTYGGWEMQALRGHALAGGLKCHNWHTKRGPEERSERATKGMPDNPDLRIGKHERDIVVEVLNSSKPKTV